MLGTRRLRHVGASNPRDHGTPVTGGPGERCVVRGTTPGRIRQGPSLTNARHGQRPTCGGGPRAGEGAHPGEWEVAGRPQSSWGGRPPGAGEQVAARGKGRSRAACLTPTTRMGTRGHGPVEVGDLQRHRRRRATREPPQRFGARSALRTPHAWLAQAYAPGKTHTGAPTPGGDGVTRRLLEVDLEHTLETLRQERNAGTCGPLPVRRTTREARQAAGRLTERRCGMPARRDRLVQAGRRMRLAPLDAADCRRHSSGCRPHRRPQDAVPSRATRLHNGASDGGAMAGDRRAGCEAVRPGTVRRLRRRRLQENQRLPLGWGVLRAGGLEGRRSRPPLAGVPQGGMVRCVRAHSSLHALARSLAQDTARDRAQRQQRQRQGRANVLSARYCEACVVRCAGSTSHAEAMRQELAPFLSPTRTRDLSMEQTRSTPVRRGGLLLGSQIARPVGQGGQPGPTGRLPDRAGPRMGQKIAQVLAPWTCQDAVRRKSIALHRLMRGWGQDYPSTASPTVSCRRLHARVFWPMAPGLGRKFPLAMPRVRRRCLRRYPVGTQTVRLLRPTEMPTQGQRRRTISNPSLAAATALHRDRGVFRGGHLGWSGAEARARGLTGGGVRPRRRSVWVVRRVCSLGRVPEGPSQAASSVQATSRGRCHGASSGPPQVPMSCREDETGTPCGRCMR